MELIKLSGNLANPRDSKPSDYSPVGPTGSEGFSSGAGQLVKQNLNQEGPQHSQDDGEHTPSKWGKAEWTVGKASEGSTSLSYKGAVDFETGQQVPNAEEQKY